MTNITLRPDKEKGITVAVRKIKHYCDEKYFFAVDMTINETHVIIYVDKLKDILKISNDIDDCIKQLIPRL